MIKHTLLSFVRQECANFTNSECLGIDVFGKRFMNQDKCLVLQKKRCDYFKKCVLPLAKLKGCYDKVINGYQKIDLVIKRQDIRKCDCGTELKKGKQVCDKCREIRRRETYREQSLKRAG